MGEAAIACTKFMSALNFTDADLKANREGAMSLRQINRYRIQCLLSIVVMAVIVLFCVMIALANWPVFELMTHSPSGLIVLGILVVFGIYATYAVYAAFGYFRRMMNDLKAGQVERLSGRVMRNTYFVQGKGGGWRYELRIIDEKFKVRRAVYEAVVNSDYHVYIMPATRIILAMESGVN